MVFCRAIAALTVASSACQYQAFAFIPKSTSANIPRFASRSTSSPLRASALEELSKQTVLSIDSGDFDVIESFAKTNLITDATTNPLFVSQAGSRGDKRYEALVEEAVTYAKTETCNLEGCDNVEDTIDLAIDRLSVNLGVEIAKLVKGKVSTEVDIRLSYDTEKSVERARRIIAMYEELGLDRKRILIKLAGTWEGIQAAAILEKEGIECNITLVFSFLQAAAAAQAGAYLISPFPGRILDWHKAKTGKTSFTPESDPGVLAVKRMYAYFRKYGYKTICMPASWRPSRGADVEGADVDEILALVGVDEMTIPPGLLEKLSGMDGSVVETKCNAESDAAACTDPDFKLTQESFEQYWKTDGCGMDKLKEGIDAFTAETEKLSKIIIEKF
mmetsp:Transcript_4227/g.5759  ORF Transcript_4227/g.5759 Transcript_4227/m.5759 type:complete len:389 (-) Transcript_4227:281-1447(-)|eukprot:CAMPEP_0185726150 /NCGR_PEP_ID=MMETSP1171-20130828/2210_1 /TAXON_ID=374046 /ORGANISM="Helicotheca tamensis, Strain CCMP826" /LENGTH=388 /DNA_ID=CAMNT_0028394445 /DNA_START=124 /DNA_END=1290 /DNA_ORIENTATION=-